MLDIKKSLEKFKSLAPEIYLTVDSEEIGNRMEKINEKYNVNLGALIIFVVLSDLEKKDIVNYLKSEFEIKDVMAEKITKDLNKYIFNPIETRLNFLNNSAEKGEEQDKKDKDTLRNIFQKKLIKELNFHPVIINAINARIFYSFSRDLNFRKELEKILLTNNERISDKKFILKKKQAAPSIANWIYYFIQIYGSGIFTNITLSKFLVDSKNVKELTKDEKEKVNNILLVYRNLKFFPESMPSDDGEGWEILLTGFEINDEKEDVELPKQVSVSEKKVYIKEKDNKKVYDRELAELELLVGKYEEGSLERKMVEEEIIKFKKKKIKEASPVISQSNRVDLAKEASPVISQSNRVDLAKKDKQ